MKEEYIKPETMWLKVDDEVLEDFFAEDLLPPTTLHEDRLLECTKIGSGTFKDVYKCYDNHLKRWVALAQPNERHLDGESVRQFLHEAWLTSSLQHPNIIKIFEIGSRGDEVPYYLMELKSNTTFAHFVENEDDLITRLESLVTIIEAIKYTHSQGVIHLDLKPENIQHDKNNDILLCDWGLAEKIFYDENGQDLMSYSHLASTSDHAFEILAKGSPGYASPEQLSGEFAVDYRSDVFAVGCLLYYALYQEHAFKGSGEELVINNKCCAYEFPKSGISNRLIKQSLKLVISKALAPVPENRYQTVEVLLADIQLALSTRPTSLDKSNLLTQLTLGLKRKSFVLIPSLLFILVTFAVVYFSSQRLRKERFNFLSEKKSLQTTLQITEKEQEVLDLLLMKSGGDVLSTIYHTNESKWYSDHKSFAVDVDESVLICERLLNLDDRFSKARLKLVKLNCIKMNFSEALRIAGGRNSRQYEEYLKFAQRYEHYKFSSSERPSIGELTSFLKDISLLEDVSTNALYEVFLYDNQTRVQTSYDYNDVVVVLLDFYNQNREGYISSHRKGELYLQSPSGIRTIANKKNTASLYSFLKLDSLVFGRLPHLDLEKLHGSQIKYLDLVEVKSFECGKKIVIKGLETVYVKSEKDKELVRKFTNDENVNIVVRKPL